MNLTAMISCPLLRRSPRSLPAALLLATAVALQVAPTVLAVPFTEPPVTLYGSVNQTADGYTVPVTSGTIQWTITPPVGAALLTSTDLGASADGQSSFYRLKVPVEKVPTGSVVSSNTINEPAMLLSFGRSGVSLNGSPLSIVFPTGTAAGAFTFNEAARGKIDRVDLVLATPFTDSDGDGLPDWFEDKYGLDKYNPYDAAGVDRHGRRSFVEDYQRHIDPFLGTEYEQWADVKIPADVTAAPMGDPDNDGVSNLVEFALDTDPKSSDAASYNARVVRGTVVVGGKTYLTLTVTLPATPRASAAYAVESSGDLQTWAGVEGTDVMTLAAAGNQLAVRDGKSIEDSANRRRFLRLRVTLARQ